MPLLGAHMSIAGGLHKAAERAAALEMETVQIFTNAPSRWPFLPQKTSDRFEPFSTKNNNQWRAKPLSQDDVTQFRTSIERHGLRHPCAHASYLINLATPADDLWHKSIDAMVVELERADALALEGVVMHPGAYVDSCEEDGLQRIVTAIDLIHQRTPNVRTEIWLEATAGQGSCLGHRFEHLAHLLAETAEADRLGICIDTCHIFAAGYPLVAKKEYTSTLQELDATVGLDRVRAFHVNDSKKECGSRVDRHAHIGEGCLGLEPFRHLLNDRRFRHLPMYLETKKETRDGEEMDAVNLRVLRGLIRQRARSGKTARKVATR